MIYRYSLLQIMCIMFYLEVNKKNNHLNVNINDFLSFYLECALSNFFVCQEFSIESLSIQGIFVFHSWGDKLGHTWEEKPPQSAKTGSGWHKWPKKKVPEEIRRASEDPQKSLWNFIIDWGTLKKYEQSWEASEKHVLQFLGPCTDDNYIDSRSEEQKII